jgi:hypothetical protein
MRELEKKQRTKKRIYSIPVLAILLVLTALIAKGTYGVMMKRAESANHVETLKAKNKNIDRLSTPEGVDREIKEKFSVSKAGEEVAIIVDPKALATSTESTKEPFYKRWWNTVRGLWED